MKRSLVNIIKKTMMTLVSVVTITTMLPTCSFAAGTSTTPAIGSGYDMGNNDNAMTRTLEMDAKITDIDRGDADKVLLNYMNSLIVRYNLNETQNNNLQDMFNSAVYYIAYTDMTIGQLQEYVASIKARMDSVATTDVSSVTSEFIQVADNWDTPVVYYGQKVSIVLPIINLGTEELNDLVVEPMVTTDVKTWPFVPDQTGYVQTEPFIPGYVSLDHAMANRREFTYEFKVRDDVMTGYYPLKFRVSYTRGGVRVENDKAAELTVYVRTIGKPESGTIGGNGNEDKVAKSRLIVTGYETSVDKIYSGDTFKLTIHIQNTSSDTAVSNILFNIDSEHESTSTATTSEYITPFIPTSGSNSIYVEKIAPKETSDISIEMSAKPGLSQRSYSLNLNMTYDSGVQFDLTDKASISIPVYQESKFDTSTLEVAPSSINVGSQSNVMFSIYNTGKTTLYNVQVTFSADSIEDNMAFVGNLQSGATGNVDVMLTGRAATMDDGSIRMVISYEDEAGNVTEIEKPCSLFVNEIMMDDMMDNPGFRDPGENIEEEKSSGALVRGIIIGVVIIAAIAVGLFFYIKTARKKEAKLKEEDLRDLEEIGELESEDK